MDLKLFYKEQFILLSQDFEPEWQEQSSQSLGYRWLKHNTRYEEAFQIVSLESEPLYCMYTICIPWELRQTNIYEVVKKYESPYELSVHFFQNKNLLSAVVNVEKLDQTILSFINKARGEMIDILDSLIYQEGP